jgi:CheY-like chemotaxis protein
MSATKRILLAEDNTNDAELTVLALAEQHLAGNVTLVRDGVEALDHLLSSVNGTWEERRPAVILLDIKMPRLGGLEVLRRIRADERLRAIPVVMLTSSREDRDLTESYRLGANAYVVKPVVFDEFLEAVKKVWGFWADLNETPPACPR